MDRRGDGFQMKSIFVFALLFCVACSGLPNVKAADSPLSTPQIGADTPQATEAPTSEPTQTQDYQATAQAAQALAQSAIDAQQVAEYDSIHAQATAQAVQVEALAITATMGAENNQAALLLSAAKGTQDAVIFAAQATAQQADIDKRDAETRRLTAEAAYIKADADSRNAWIGQSFYALTLLIIGFAVLALLRLTRKNQAEPEYDENEAEREPVQPSAPVRLWEVEGNTINRDTEPPGDPEKFRRLIAHGKAGNQLGKNFVVAARIYGSYAEYSDVLSWLEKKEYAAPGPNGAKVFTLPGQQFCDEWEAIHPSPITPGVQKSPDLSYNQPIIG